MSQLRYYFETSKICSIARANSEELDFTKLNYGSVSYGCPVSKVLSDNIAYRMFDANFIAAYDISKNEGYVAMASSSDAKHQLLAAVCLECMLIQKRYFYLNYVGECLHNCEVVSICGEKSIHADGRCGVT